MVELLKTYQQKQIREENKKDIILLYKVYNQWDTMKWGHNVYILIEFECQLVGDILMATSC